MLTRHFFFFFALNQYLGEPLNFVNIKVKGRKHYLRDVGRKTFPIVKGLIGKHSRNTGSLPAVYVLEYS